MPRTATAAGVLQVMTTDPLTIMGVVSKRAFIDGSDVIVLRLREIAPGVLGAFAAPVGPELPLTPMETPASVETAERREPHCPPSNAPDVAAAGRTDGDSAAHTDSTKLLTAREVTDTCGMHYTTLCHWVRAGMFPRPIKLASRRVVWRENDIQAWLDNNRATETRFLKRREDGVWFYQRRIPTDLLHVWPGSRHRYIVSLKTRCLVEARARRVTAHAEFERICADLRKGRPPPT